MPDDKGTTSNGRGPGGADGRMLWSDVEAALKDAKQRTTAKGQASLDRVFAALLALRRDGLKITVEAVAGRCPDGLTAQSIRNNDRLNDLVRIAASTQVAVAKAAGGGAIEVRLLDQIGNPELRAELEQLLAHRRSLISENSGLRNAVRRLEAISYLNREMAEDKVETLEELATLVREFRGKSGGLTFSSEEIAACASMLDRLMPAAGLHVDEASGAIVDRIGRTVADRGVEAVLRKVSVSRAD